MLLHKARLLLLLINLLSNAIIFLLKSKHVILLVFLLEKIDKADRGMNFLSKLHTRILNKSALPHEHQKREVQSAIHEV